MSTPKPTEWHRKPKTVHGPCPICGCPRKVFGEHRRFPVSEDTDAVWERRQKGRTGWQYYHIGSRRQQTINAEAAKAKARKREEETARRKRSTKRPQRVRMAAPVSATKEAKQLQDSEGYRGQKRSPALWDFLYKTYLPLHPGISAGYLVQLETTVRLLQRWHGRPLRIADLSESLLRGFLAAYNEDRTPVTVNAKRRQLLTLCRAAYQEGLLPKLPERIPRLREPRRMPDAWTVDEVSQLIRYARTLTGNVDGTARATFWPSLFSTAYWTGCRATALRLTRTPDCDLDAGWLLARAETMKTDCDQLFQLSDQAVAELRSHFNGRRKLIWPWPNHERTFTLHCRRIMEAAGLRPSLRGMGLMQKLRRTAITYAACESLELARLLAGHSSAQLTQKHYVDQRIARMPSPAAVLPKLDI